MFFTIYFYCLLKLYQIVILRWTLTKNQHLKNKNTNVHGKNLKRLDLNQLSKTEKSKHTFFVEGLSLKNVRFTAVLTTMKLK